jgi:hypothetical protein
VTGHVDARPGDHVSVLGYSRPSVTYGVVRGDAVVPDSGRLDYTFHPTTNTRLYAASPDCGSSPTVVVTVHGRLTMAARRDGAKTYTFTGAISPASAYEGQVVKLFYLRGTTPVQKGAGRVHAGKVAITVRFATTGRQTLFLATAANGNNGAARSADRPTVIS